MKKIISLVIMFLTSEVAMAENKYTSDVTSIENIMKAYYQVVSAPAGVPRQIERDKFIHHEKASMLFPLREANKPENFEIWSIDEFHKSEQQSNHNQLGFFENEIGRKVVRFGRTATVMSVYESRRDPDGPVFSRGVNFLQLFFGKDKKGVDRWFITSTSFERETEDQPIPETWINTFENL